MKTKVQKRREALERLRQNVARAYEARKIAMALIDSKHPNPDVQRINADGFSLVDRRWNRIKAEIAHIETLKLH